MTFQNSKLVLSVYKPIGWTPLEAIEKLRVRFPKLSGKKIGYAGRLDPMAHGVLLLLVEPETKKRLFYQKLDKKYTFTILFGVKTDSYDTLGIPVITSPKVVRKGSLSKAIKTVAARKTQIPPVYSAVRVEGKPLYWWQRHGKIDEVTIPQIPVDITDIRLLTVSTISKEKLMETINDRVSKIRGVFRTKSILSAWRKTLSDPHLSTFYTAKVEVKVSSGTYIRSLCHDIGEILGSYAIALDIRRDSVGSFTLEKTIKLSKPNN